MHNEIRSGGVQREPEQMALSLELLHSLINTLHFDRYTLRNHATLGCSNQPFEIPNFDTKQFMHYQNAQWDLVWRCVQRKLEHTLLSIDNTLFLINTLHFDSCMLHGICSVRC
jgi:hypothetical protein